MFRTHTTSRGFTLIELLVVIAIIGILSSVVLSALNSGRPKARDATRLSQFRQIQYALEQYYDANGKYPTCLYGGGSCVTSLTGSIFMKQVPKDPLTNLGYTYAANGTGANCTSYHLGVSMEGKVNNKYMQSGSDATPQALCTGSLPDFSGLSYAAGGQLCNTSVGIAQPSAAATAETCRDAKP